MALTRDSQSGSGVQYCTWKLLLCSSISLSSPLSWCDGCGQFEGGCAKSQEQWIRHSSLALNGHHIKIRSHQPYFCDATGQQYRHHSMGSRMVKPTCPLLRVHWYLLLALLACEMHAYEVYAYRYTPMRCMPMKYMPLRQMPMRHTHETHACEIRACEMHACEMHACGMHTYGIKPVGCTP
jgi:hypothetical protein